MKASLARVGEAVAASALVCFGAAVLSAADPAAASWSPKAAAGYLDQRAGWWMDWAPAARDHGTFCISCHTAVPYALARPALRAPLAEAGPSANERRLLDNVTRRVRSWSEMAPFYTDEKYGPHKSEQARGTEAVLNALVLASRDVAAGTLSADARTALGNMWALQLSEGPATGAWAWLQFDNEPWEAFDSQYYGACLAAVAVGSVPDAYGADPAIESRMRLLRDYLNREYARQSLINRAVLLWASSRWPGLMAPDRRRDIIDGVLAAQRADGGWSAASLVGPWKRADGTPLETESDGYATGLIALALERSGVPQSEPHLRKGLAWLAQHQNPAEGWWPAWSLNRKLDPAYGPGRFMNDAATAYAVLALTASGAH